MVLAALSLASAAAGCSSGDSEAFAYPETARREFAQSCPLEEGLCACNWDALTHSVPFEDYQAAKDRFRTTGLMDPRIVRAREACL